MREKIYAVIEPKYNNKDSRAARIYDWVMLVAIALGITPLVFREQPRVFFYFDIFSCTVYIVDYLLRWLTADLRRAKRGNVWSFLAYPFTPLALIDLLSILPSFRVINEAFKITRFVRLLKVIRVVKIIRYFEPLKVIMDVIRKQRSLLLTVLGLSIFYVFVTALIMFNAEEQINPETGQFLFNSFFDAFYWAACTLTTVGYGDIYPISSTGRVISIISMIVGIAIIALPSGIITAGYMEEMRERRIQAKKTVSKKHPDQPQTPQAQ